MSQNMVEMGLMVEEDEESLLNDMEIGENDRSNITEADSEYNESEEIDSMIMMGNRESKMISSNDNGKNNNLPYITNIS
jgi:hypothetical protein